MLKAFGVPPQSIHSWAWDHKATEGHVMVCSTSVRPPGWKDSKTGESEMPTLRAFCGFGWREDLPAWLQENNNILACCWSSMAAVCRDAADVCPGCGSWQGTHNPKQYRAVSCTSWRNNVQTVLQRVDFTDILRHRCVFFCHPTTWFWVLSSPPAIFFLYCNYCWECDPACWLWCHAHFLCRSWCRQPFWVADGD